jgi:hypothetical protein
MICTLSTSLHRLTQKHLCWHSITKILRNGPRAHFPFTYKCAHLGAPTTGEALLIYVAATTQVVSVAIVVERREEGHALLVQRPIYFISEVLSETKIGYP